MPVPRPLYILLIALSACNGGRPENPFAKQLAEPPYREWSDRIKSQPNNDSLYYARGVLLMQNDQREAAKIDLEEAWSLQTKPSYALALATLLDDSPADQLRFMQQAVTALPEVFELDWALAHAYQQNDSIDAALRITNDWIQRGAREPDFVLLHASLLKTKERSEEALQWLEGLYRQYPGQREIAEMLALWYAGAGNEKVLSVAERLRSTDSLGKDPLPDYYLGIYYAQKKQYEAALRAFDRSLLADYHFAEAYLEKAAVLYEQKQWTAAITLLEKALAVAPDNASVYFWTAKCQQAQGDKESARLNYLKAYGLDKTFIRARQAADELK